MINPMSFNPIQTQSVKLTDTSSITDKTTPSDMRKSFSDFLKNAIDGVSSQEQNAQAMNDQYILGNVDVSQVMIASQQAELGLQLTSQIRNKVIEAYQEIMRMQI
ncbi:flagellar hook-basal body complex protein FliE [Paenibacillus taihuensis]|uniref:Flagellar hook-basal body complex protein FliE n=1 Tax=Paenibacillus taihuensis TaxID=1156355 RepID=A0A3D9SEU2_9BACL|nr:flagellar hook-basal body complex protein FliE [Paenibacillus taihuensis]REE94412.1 flagellar hook-basal body complex protein FliE [Paenibacillus taihuensis]